MSSKNLEDLQMLTDEELINDYHGGSNSGLVQLVARYIDVIDRKLGRYPYLNEEAEDVKQEALISFLNAVKAYDPRRGSKFATFASHCLDNSIKNSIMKASAKKLQLLKNSVSIDKVENLNQINLIESDPEEIYIDKEQYIQLLNRIDIHLTDFEKNVLFCYLDGKSYNMISTSLNSSQKAVDNALQRVRRKLKTVFNQ